MIIYSKKCIYYQVFSIKRLNIKRTKYKISGANAFVILFTILKNTIIMTLLQDFVSVHYPP